LMTSSVNSSIPIVAKKLLLFIPCLVGVSRSLSKN
jgi:hypothetical protein